MYVYNDYYAVPGPYRSKYFLLEGTISHLNWKTRYFLRRYGWIHRACIGIPSGNQTSDGNPPCSSMIFPAANPHLVQTFSIQKYHHYRNITQSDG